MNDILGLLRYHGSVNVAGRAALRVERIRGELKMRRPGFWKNQHLAPPLECSPQLKELIVSHYLRGRYANDAHKVAWVTSGAPVEFLIALGYYVMYPENHGAVCGIRRSAEELCGIAEDAGYSRDMCSYARTDIGSALSGKTPVGRLPKPDLLVCCTNICQTVLYWYRVLAHHFGCALAIIDTPFVYDQATDAMRNYVKQQIEGAVLMAERVAGKSLDWRHLRKVTQRSKDAVDLWLQILQCGQTIPTPITAFDEFIHMAPIVEMRGEVYTVEYYRTMLAELRRRISNGVGAVVDERKRLLWDNLPIWHRMRWLGDLLAENGAALVCSTYTNAWGELAPMIDPDNPLESAADAHMHAILNRSTGDKLKTIREMAILYSADGVILHSDRSCKPYSIGQIDQRDNLAGEIGVPALLLEADHNDPRMFSEEQASGRIHAFLEMLEG